MEGLHLHFQVTCRPSPPQVAQSLDHFTSGTAACTAVVSGSYVARTWSHKFRLSPPNPLQNLPRTSGPSALPLFRPLLTYHLILSKTPDQPESQFSYLYSEGDNLHLLSSCQD